MKKILVAGATGNLGNRIVRALNQRGAEVVALIRKGTEPDKSKPIQDMGAKVEFIDPSNVDQIAKASAGAACLVSALQGLRDVIIDTQKSYLDGAIKAGVPRFIPSDFCTDFRAQPEGENRNFDLRREFHKTLDTAPIQSTSIFNGAFSDLLTNNIPLLDFKNKSIGYWEDPDWQINFTTMDDTAAYTAAAALDDSTPAGLRIAGFRPSPRELQQFTAKLFGKPFALVNLGTLESLAAKNRRDRAEHPEGEDELYSGWQQGQYLQSMFSFHHESLDNHRYPGLKWTTLEEAVQPPA